AVGFQKPLDHSAPESPFINRALGPPSGTETVIVQAPAQVSGFLGNSLILPCLLKSSEPNVQVTQVTWMRRDPDGDFHSVAVFHPQRGSSLAEPERVEFVGVAADVLNASLRVSPLRVEDEASYTCQFATFPRGSRKAETRLRVLVRPNSTAEAKEVTLPPPTGQPVPMACCTSTRGRPPARVSWSSLLGGSANSTLVPEPASGTYTVISLFTLVPSSEADGRNVTCRVEHESLEEPVLLPVTLTVHYPPEVSISGYDGNWYVGQRNVTLNCEARGNPEPTGYDWNTTTGSLPSFAVAQGTQLLISTVDLSINTTTFICLVTNTLGTSQKEQTILVKGEESFSLRLSRVVTIAAAATAAIALLVVLLVVMLVFYPRQRGRPGESPPSRAQPPPARHEQAAPEPHS
uniref:Ig-like domain-containing protein n=1 Tax=Sciurus vulgaris TaxID=55149 RepID=A0A8D2DF29_SCIVU